MALPFLQGGSLEITLTVPLINNKFITLVILYFSCRMSKVLSVPNFKMREFSFSATVQAPLRYRVPGFEMNLYF